MLILNQPPNWYLASILAPLESILSLTVRSSFKVLSGCLLLRAFQRLSNQLRMTTSGKAFHNQALRISLTSSAILSLLIPPTMPSLLPLEYVKHRLTPVSALDFPSACTSLIPQADAFTSFRSLLKCQQKPSTTTLYIKEHSWPFVILRSL